MEFFRTDAKYLGPKRCHKLNVPIFSFIEDGGIHMIYAPSLDLTGYGKSENEAKESFGVALEELIRYTENKNTVYSMLTDLGWVIKKKSKNVTKFEAPSLTQLLSRDTYLDEIFSNKDFNKYSTEIALPA